MPRKIRRNSQQGRLYKINRKKLHRGGYQMSDGIIITLIICATIIIISIIGKKKDGR